MIDEFQGEYRRLSNFWVEADGLTAEHRYQAAKCLRPEDAAAILAAPTPGAAKRLGQRVELRPGWDHQRVSVMTDITRQKYRDPELAAFLLATGEQELVEGNTWGDRFWGVSGGEGWNALGQILMNERAYLRLEQRDFALFDDDDGYPTDDAVEALHRYRGTPEGMVALLAELWMTPKPAVTTHADEWGREQHLIRLVTGGWSGNETLISALSGTMFSLLGWRLSQRGGLHEYEIADPLWASGGVWGERLPVRTSVGHGDTEEWRAGYGAGTAPEEGRPGPRGPESDHLATDPGSPRTGRRSADRRRARHPSPAVRRR